MSDALREPDRAKNPMVASERARIAWAAALTAGIVLFSASTAWLNHLKYVTLRSSWTYDLAYFRNAAFNAWQGRTWSYISPWAWYNHADHDGPSLFRSGHFSPIQFLSFYLSPRVEILMLVQSLFIGLGALPIYFMTRRLTRDRTLAAVCAFAYLMHPLVLHLAFNDIRPIEIGIPFALFALWFHATGRMALFSVSALLMMASRPEYALLLVLFPLLNRWVVPADGRTFRWVAWPIVLACVWAGVTQLYYLHTYDRSWPLLGRTAGSQSAAGLILELGNRLPNLLRNLVLPGVICLLAPEALAVILFFAAGADRITWPDFPQADLHHLCPVVPPLFWGMMIGLHRMRSWWSKSGGAARRDSELTFVVALVSLVWFAGFAWAAGAYYLNGQDDYPGIEETDRLVPADATVLVPMKLSARYAGHTRLLVYQVIPAPGWATFDDAAKREVFRRLAEVSDLVVVEESGGLDDLVTRTGRFEPPRVVAGCRVYLPRPGAPRPAEPDLVVQGILGWDRLKPFQRRWLPGPR